MENMKFELEVEVFEGPMDLLYHLIEKDEIDIYDIPIADITNQYLNYIKDYPKDMDSLSSFLVMAANLIEIKSKMLLPSPKLDVDDEDIDPREELVRRLLEYKKFKEISKVLEKYHEDNKNIIFKEKEEELKDLILDDTGDVEEVLEGVTMDLLFEVFTDTLKRKELKVDKIRSTFGSVKKDRYTVEEKADVLRERLKREKKFIFSDIFSQDTEKMEVVVTFLALLELIKLKEIKIIQENPFDKIFISEYI